MAGNLSADISVERARAGAKVDEATLNEVPRGGARGKFSYRAAWRGARANRAPNPAEELLGY